ncbi:hypothetical protein TSUD_39180 [Trifolium subterraneum]|uniref:SPARK domain-containing protein n=1 Tax=Trifolium subterraneum TaxID=3900 RepID=A0A2Z6MD92_TRISU|nr:hypothetical protein TSUD_39180 [Trifolium subterraneum]
MIINNIFIFFFLTTFPLSSLSATCPLNFTILTTLNLNTGAATIPPSSFTSTPCQFVHQALRLVQSDYLRRTDFFLPPLNSSIPCWDSFQSYINQFAPNFNIRSSCGFQTNWISQGCVNVTTRQQFESIVPKPTIQNMQSMCNQSIQDNSPCALCTTSLSGLPPLGQSIGNLSDCTGYPSIYAAAFSNQFGPSDPGTAKCLFALDFTSGGGSGSKKKVVIIVVVCVVTVLVLLLIVIGFWVYWKFNDKAIGDGKDYGANIGEAGSVSGTGNALDVIEDGMPEQGSNQVLEKYVLIAVLCSHPQLYARPTMDQVVKMMETEDEVPTIPGRPIPLVAGRLDIERSASSFGGSGQLSSPTGYQSFTLEMGSEHHSSNHSRDEKSSTSRMLSMDSDQ